MATIFKALLLKLLTKAFLGKLIVLSLEAMASRTDNKVDDKIVEAVKEALDVKTEKAA